MEAEPILGVFAQLAVFIVGLSGIVGVVGSRVKGNWQIADFTRFWTMMASGFLLLFQALLPILLHYFSLTPHAVWGWSSAAAALLLCGVLYWRLAHFRLSHADPEFNPFLFWESVALQTVAAIVLILNTTGLGFERTFAPYLLAMFLILAVSCQLFIRLLIVALPRN
jgi:hypothetical protein